MIFSKVRTKRRLLVAFYHYICGSLQISVLSHYPIFIPLAFSPPAAIFDYAELILRAEAIDQKSSPNLISVMVFSFTEKTQIIWMPWRLPNTSSINQLYEKSSKVIFIKLTGFFFFFTPSMGAGRQTSTLGQLKHWTPFWALPDFEVFTTNKQENEVSIFFGFWSPGISSVLQKKDLHYSTI